MRKLGIIGAMELEVETLVKEMCVPTSRKIAGSIFYEGVLEGLPVVVVQCGIGKVNAAICTQILCDCFDVSHIVNTGIAGSLTAELDIGDLIISSEAMYHDFDCTHFGYPHGKVPGMDTVSFPSDTFMMTAALAAAQQVHPGHCRIGKIASGDQFVADATLKGKIIAVSSAHCTEMEGAAIAHTAYRNQIPFVILRAISDKADDSAQMDYPTFERQAAHRCAEVTKRMARELVK